MLGVKHRIGGYRVIAPIGAGGFATVFRALDEETGKEVAIKVLAENHSLVADTRRRFEEEMGLLMTVKNPAIAKIYKVGETEDGQPFMVLELADRGDLRRRVEEIRGNRQVLSREDLTMLANHLYDSLRHLHGMEIVHRDVSPGNILIRSRQVGGERAPGITLLESGERFLLTDLGHAKDMILASGFTAGGGTRGFASPEQRDDVTVVDQRADIFAATAILEWAAHDGLYAEALDPFFDIGLAAEPEDRFDSMEEWHTSFRETMAATMLYGPNRSKVGRVFRRLTSGKPIVDDADLDDPDHLNHLDHLNDLDDLTDLDRLNDLHHLESLEALNPEMLLGETAVSGPPAELVPPAVPGQAKVVQPPGSPGDHSIGRVPGGTKPRSTSSGPPAGIAAPAARVDPETLVDTLTAANPAEDEPSRKKSRRLAFAVGTLVVGGMLAFGLAQELGNPTGSLGSMAREQISGPVAEPLDDTTPEPEQPADLLVAVEPDEQNRDEDGDGIPEDSRFLHSSQDVDEVTDPDRPTVFIASPEPNQELTVDQLTITGTASASEGIDRVQVSIRNLDTLQYWNREVGEFQPDWATVTINVAEGTGEQGDEPNQHRVLAWSITVPADELIPGTYEIRTWLRPSGTTVVPRNDSRTVTVIDS